MDIGDWLRNLGLGQYEAAFRENGVNAEVLCHLTADDLKELGVTAVGHRRQLLIAIARLQDDAAPAQPVGQTENHRTSLSATERRQITVLFCDIVGSTPLSTGLDPEELREILSAYQASVAAAVVGKQGYIARFVGDGVLAYFGWPNPDEAHAESAVRAALAIIEAIRPQRLAVRIGIATGLVVTGDLAGAGNAQTVTAVGETPNLAARLQGLAQPDTVVVSEATHLQLGQMFELEDLGLIALKGFGKPVRAWRILRDTGAVSRSEVIYETRPTPLVDREDELDLLLRRWQKAKNGEGRVVLLAGEAGIGKSRLLATLEECLAGESHLSLRYFCSPHHQDSPLYPLITRMEREAGFVRRDTIEDRLTKLEALLAPSAPAAEEVALFASLLSIPTEGRYPVLALSPQQWKVRMFTAIQQRLVNLARRKPVLILLEDAHWLDPTSVELLDAVIEQVPDLPVLLVVSFRPEFAAPWFGRPGVSLMTLSRLDRQDAAALATQAVKSHALSSPLLERIVSYADGVPLFIEELTRAVLEAPDTASAGAALSVPTTLQASLMARLDRLPAAKQVAQVGAVIGREFPHKLLTATAGLPEAQLMEGLTQLATAGLVFRRGVPPDAVYQFKHALVRDVAYASLPKAARQTLHGNIGNVMQEQLTDRAEVEPEVVAYHFAQAGVSETAIAWWGKAAALVMQRAAFAEAIAHLEKALALSETLGETDEQRLLRLRLQITYGNALRMERGFAAPETRAAFVRARGLATTIADGPERFAADYGLWSASFVSGDLPMMRELADAFLHNIERWSGQPEAGVAHRVCGMTCWYTGDFSSARLHLESARACYDGERNRPLTDRLGQDLAVAAMVFLALTLWPLGIGEGARRLIEEAITHALKIKHIPTIAYAYVHAAIFEQMRRDRLRCMPYVQAYLDIAREHGMPQWLAVGAFHEGWVRWDAGNHEAGAAHIHSTLEQIRKVGVSVTTPLTGVLLAEAEAEAGCCDAALALVDSELETMMRTGECWYLAEAHRVRGELLLKARPASSEAAEEAFTHAIKIAREQSARRFELHAAMRLAQLWTAQGKRTEHRGLLAILADGLADGSDMDGFAAKM